MPGDCYVFLLAYIDAGYMGIAHCGNMGSTHITIWVVPILPSQHNEQM